MRTPALIMCSCAVLALGIANTEAGPCTTEIENLTKTLAAKDQAPGQGKAASTSSTPSRTTGQAEQHPPTAVMSQTAQGRAASPDDVRRQVAGQSTAADQASGTSQAPGAGGQHPPTATMSQATQGQAAPAAPGQHPPTAVMSGATQGQTAPDQAGSAGAMQARAALARARELDGQGKEAECMEAIRQAKQL
jgi:hypothetical protein